MSRHDTEPAGSLAPSGIFELAAGGASYRMVLPNAGTDYIQRTLAAQRVPYELAMLEDMRSRLAAGELVVDAGANIGNHTLFLAAAAGCRVAAFEPNAALAQALAASVGINGLGAQVEVHRHALGKAPGKGRFARDIPDNLGAQSILAGDGEIEIRPLDDIAFGARVAAIKIDVEGMEPDVLEGARALVARDRPLLYVECADEASLRRVHGWMTANGYGYWDTFNATPTHLFLPNEQVTVEQRLARLQLKGSQDAYRLAGEMARVREMLDSANLKYRGATEQVSGLKAQLAQEEAARRMAQQAAGEAAERFTQARERLDAERALLQQEVGRVTVLAEARGAAAHDAERRLARLDAELEAARAGLVAAAEQQAARAAGLARRDEALAEANAKYRALNEQCRQLKETAHSERGAAQLLGQRHAQLQAELLEARMAAERAAGAAAQQATAQAHRLEQRIAQLQGELVEERLAVARATATAAQQASTQARLLEELAAQQSENAAVRSQAAQAVNNVHKHEKRWLRAETELKAALAGKAEAEAACRAARDEEAACRQRAIREEQAALAAERLWGEVQEALLAEKEEGAALRARLEQANLKYRHAMGEEIPQLKARLEAEQALARERQQGLDKLRQELGGGRQALAEAHDQLQRLRQQKRTAEQQVVKARASLSFQLGHILISGSKSLRGFAGMPAALAGWGKEAARRRRQARERQARLQAVPVPPAAPASVAPPVPPVPAAPAATAQQAWPQDLRQLKVACIMDEFSFNSFGPECTLLQLTPAAWQAELDGFAPQLLLIESAWRGKDALWGNKVGHLSQELQGIVALCRGRGVPTAFWNKEDPVHFDTFLSTAALFDGVFTTDLDCIHRYKAALGHERVYLLPFACQPASHNPVETCVRKDAFCFAGAYYVRYPERTRDLANFIGALPDFRPLEIYDRNFGNDDPNYQFPEAYRPYIVGTLPFDRIDEAYKGYRYAINLNSIKQSQTMFARRVYELMASNTLVASNFSRGLRLMFGDLAIATDSGADMVRRLAGADPTRAAKTRLAALRKVLREHTYEQRLAYVAARLSGQAPARRTPAIAMVGAAASPAELALLLAHFRRQRHAACSLAVLLADGVDAGREQHEAGVRLLPRAHCAGQPLSALAGGADFVAGIVAQDYYGPNYLLDIALATSYSAAGAIGKAARYAWRDGAAVLEDAAAAYRPAAQLDARCAAARVDRVAALDACGWIDALAQAALPLPDTLAIDQFNYCRDGAGASRVAEAVDDLQGLDTGMELGELLRLAEGILPAARRQDSVATLAGSELAGSFGRAPGAAVRVRVEGQAWHVESSLAEGKHEYLYATADAALASLGWTDRAAFYLDATPGLQLQLVLVFLDSGGRKLGHAMGPANRNHAADIPPGTASIRFGLRIFGAGSAAIEALVLGPRDLQPPEIIGRAERLVLTNHYPSSDDLYRNGFVHSRVLAYRERGMRCDVFRMRPGEPVSYHEFENVDVTTGSQEALHRMLSGGRYRTVMVHFLEPAMWEVLRHHIERVRVVVWVHGAEIQPAHRRAFSHATEEERTVARRQSEARMEFWRGLLRELPANLKLVFVSRYFAEEVMEDLGFRIPEAHYEIIHNPIDTDIFRYRDKPLEQRKKVLSIRPYASAKYANDLSVKAIELLSSEPWFRDMEFRMIGDGPLFDQTLAPLRGFDNVHIERRFLTRAEIAALHQEYGVFLSPTRMDAQGVARDEAMASGLVPVTNAVAAIPEFVDERCGMLAPGDDAAALASGIAALYRDPALFAAMSKAASERVARQSAKRDIVNAEVRVLQ